MISFNSIPVNLRTPGAYVEFDNSRAVQSLAVQPHRILVIGQRLSTGTVAELVAVRVTSGEKAEEYFGRGSQLAAMIKAAKLANPYTDLWAMALNEDGAGAAAAGSLTFGGSATAAGTIFLYVGGVRLAVGVASGSSATAIASAVAAAINARTDLPITASPSAGVVTTTCRWKGTTGNDIDLRVNYDQGETLPAGVTLGIVAMVNGATDPDIAPLIAALGDEQYNTIISAWRTTTVLNALDAELADRWGPARQIEGHAFCAVRGSFSTMSTLGAARNSPFVTIVGAGTSPTPSWIWAAVVGALDAGEPDPARPRQTLLLRGCLAPDRAARLTRAERNLLLFDGISTFVVDDGGLCRVERLITTYQTNALGAEDISYLDITTMRTLAFLRYAVRSRILLRYPRHKLASDGTRFAPGQAVVTPSSIRSELLSMFLREWEPAGLVEGFAQYKDELLVERSSTDPNRVDVQMSPDLMNQFRVFAGQIQFLL